MESAAAGTSPITVTYPSDLPIAERRDELMAAIRDHQVVVVAGETGSGKSTLLHLLATLDAPDEGRVEFDGRRIDNLQPIEMKP